MALAHRSSGLSFDEEFRSIRQDLALVTAEIRVLHRDDREVADSIRPTVTARFNRMASFFVEHTHPGEVIQNVVHAPGGRCVVRIGTPPVERPVTLQSLLGAPDALIEARGMLETALWTIHRRVREASVPPRLAYFVVGPAPAPAPAQTPSAPPPPPASATPTPPPSATGALPPTAATNPVQPSDPDAPPTVTPHEVSNTGESIVRELAHLSEICRQTGMVCEASRRLDEWTTTLEGSASNDARRQLVDDIAYTLPRLQRDLLYRLRPDQIELEHTIMVSANYAAHLARNYRASA